MRSTGLTLTPRGATVTTVTDSRMSPLGTVFVLVTDCDAVAMQLALRVCWSALPRRAFHPVVSCRWRRGFYRPRGCGLNGTDSVCVFLGAEVRPSGPRVEKWKMRNGRCRRCRSAIYRGKMAGDCWRILKLRMSENEEPCWLCGRAGFSKIDDLGIRS